MKSPSNTELRVPAHGHGRLRVGGTNRGGPGRPSSVIREACREAFADRVDLLAQIADNGAVGVSDRIWAIETLGKYGLGTIQGVSADDVRERLRQTLAVIRGMVPPDQAERIVNALRPIWL